MIEQDAVEPRNLDQNARLQAKCGEISAQVRLTSDGRYVNVKECPDGRKIDRDSWRWMFVGSVKGWKALPAIDGDGFIMLGGSSRQLNMRDCAEVIDLAQHFGDSRGVIWSEPGQAKA